MNKAKFTYSIVAIGCLVAGSLVYITARPYSLLMFQWFELVGWSKWIFLLRTHLSNLFGGLPRVFILSGPFALWVLSYLIFIKVIWYGESSHLKHVWFWVIPILAIGTELLQNSPRVPGRFDIVDINAIVIAVIIARIIIPIERYTLKKERR
ncbi:hypothetical protein KAU86_02395 [bacterium]|nr:hypothetical protein [bacterium]MCK4436778.1 hypothetical protein [bacterium]